MLELDGTDGGGQLVRTALTLSVLDERPFRMRNVRGDRPNPGLKRQHLACVEVLADLADADVSGAKLDSETLTFEPGGSVADSDSAGSPAPADPDADVGVDVAADVGTAGSVTLVADAVLPLAARTTAPVRVRLVGGTDVKWSPPADYLRHVKLPLLRECGLDAAVEVRRRGFYPVGGGELLVDVRPSELSPIELPGRDAVRSGWNWTVRAVASRDLEDADVADRMAEATADALSDQEIAADPTASATYADADSPGAVLTIVAESDDARESTASRARPRAGFTAFGEPGVPSEDVASEAVDAAERWRERDASIDPHLGDQLVVWLALAGGRVRVPRVTDHVRTNVDLVGAFGYDVWIEGGDADDTEATLVASGRE